MAASSWIALLTLIFLATFHSANSQVRCYASTDCRGGVVEVFAPRMQGDRRQGDCCGGRGLSFADSGIPCQNCFREEAFTSLGDEFFLAFFNNRRFLPEGVRGLSKIRISVGAMEDNVEFMVVTEKETCMLTTGTSPEPTVVTLTDETLRLEDSGDRDGAVLVKSMDGRGLSVIALAEDLQSSDSFKSIPCVFLPDFQYEYYIVSVPNNLEEDFLENAQGAFAIIPSEDATITLRVTADVDISETDDLADLPELLRANTSVTFTLGRMQTLYISASGVNSTGDIIPSDLTGSRILSDKPLSVITGHECGNVPEERDFCDQLAEQVPPTTTWGTRFFTAPFAGRTAFDMFRVVAAKNNTNFTGMCMGESAQNFHFSLQKGEWEEFMVNVDQFCSFESTEPVLLVQFSVASTTDNVTFADPFMVIVPPVEQYQNSYLIDTLSSTRDVTETSYINIFVPLPYDRSGVLLDGQPIPESEVSRWIEIDCPEGESTCGYGRQVEVDAGTHILNHSNPEARLNAIVYWFSFRVGHGYFAGMTQRPIALPSVTLGSDAEDVFENATSITFTLTRTGNLRQTSTVFILTRDLETEEANRTARAGTDYTALNSTVVFQPGEQTQQVQVGIIDDVFPEENKTFEVFLAASPGVYLTPFAYTVVRILNDDPPLPVMNVSFASTSITVREGMGIVEFVLRKTEGAIGDVSVRIMTTDGTANGEEDYDPIVENVTFGVEDLEARVTTLIFDNLALEERESFTAEIFPIRGPFPVAVMNSTATVLIDDNDIVVIGFMPVVYSAEESGFVPLMIVLQFGTLAREVTINVITVDGSATAPSDYTAVSTSVLFAPFTQSQTVVVPLNDDIMVEFSEDFTVRLELENSDDGDNVLLLPNEASVTITDNDRARIGLEVPRNRVSENEGSVRVMVRVLEGNLRGRVTLGLSTLSKNASAVDDFQSIISRQIVLEPDADTAMVDVGIVNDATSEETEAFVVLLGLLSGEESVAIGPTSVEIAITDDDIATTQIPCFTQDQCAGVPLMARSVQECCVTFGGVTFNPEATVDFCQTCILIGFAQREYTLDERPQPHRLTVQPVRGFLPQDMMLAVTALAGTASVSDFRLETQRVVLLRNSPQGTVEITLFQEDSLDDAELETLTLRLSDEFGFGPPNLFFRDARVNIEDIVVRVRFATTEYTVREGEGLSLLIASNGRNADPLSIQLSAQDGTAIAGEDYTFPVTSFTLAPGRTQLIVTVPIINDLTVETLSESFTVELTAEGEAVIITSNTATVTILDDDVVTVGFEQPVYTTIEGEEGSVEVCALLRTGLLQRTAVVTLSTAPGSATGSEDYIRVVRQLIFDSETSRQCVSITIINDNIAELTEDFFVDLSTDDPSVTLDPSRATVMIEDTDALCPDPPALVNGMVTFTGNSVGDTATYTCNSGFELIGSATATCREVGGETIFSPAPPVCRPLCPDPADIMNGTVSFTGNSVGDTATYTCDSGFELVGTATLTCAQVDVNTAVFSPAPPVCIQTAEVQVNCYSELQCQGPATVSTIEECCLTSDGVTLASGLTFDQPGGELCQTCVVFGWRNEFTFVASERGEAYSLAVGYLKGADRAPGNGRLRFDVEDTEGTAVEGASNDYRVSNTQNLDVRTTRDTDVQVTFRVDNVALEPDETLTLTLDPQNTLAMALDPNVFLLETIQLTIQDSDVVTFQFTESEYRTREEERTVPVRVERNLRIATDLTLRITPVNFTVVNVTGFPFPDDFPDVPEFDPIRPIVAASLPEDARDFNIIPIEVTFPRDEINNSADIDAPVSVFDDVVNEADEVFVVLLEVVSDVPLAQVNLVPRNASLYRIVDNDPINIGFEFPRYDFEEQFRSFGEDSPVFLIKENNRESEQTFEVVVTAGPAQDPGLEDATPIEAATADNPPDFRVTTVQIFIFEPFEDRIPVPFQLFDDLNPELLEGFLLSSSPDELSPPFQSGVNPSTTIAIIDDDLLVIGFTETFTSVSEGVGQFELCLNVTVPEPQVELPANLFVFIELLTEDGTALEIEDYVRIDDSTNPLNDFSDGRRSQCFDVTIQDDSRFELTEQFSVTAFPFSPDDPVVVTPNVSVVEIVDDDGLVCYSEGSCDGETIAAENSTECCRDRTRSYRMGSRSPCLPCAVSSRASEFYIGFMNNPTQSLDSGATELYISTLEENNVTVVVRTATGFQQQVIVDPNVASVVTLPMDIQARNVSDRNKGILVRAEEGERVSVVGNNMQLFSVSAFLSLPCTPLPIEEYEFYAISVPAAPNMTNFSSAFLIVACSDSTEVSFTPTQVVADPDNPTFTVNPGESRTVVLNEGQTLYIQSVDDLTGSRVVTNKPVSFFSGHECGRVPASLGDCDHLVEQIPPTAVWGLFFLTAPIGGRMANSNFTIVASQDDTSVSVTCSNNTIFPDISIASAGGSAFFETGFNVFCFVEATKPILLAQFTPGTQADLLAGDPFMVTVPPVHQYTNQVLFSTLDPVFELTFVNIYVPAAFFDPAMIKLDGMEIEGWIPIEVGDNICGYAVVVEIASGDHTVVHEDEAASLGVTAYGLAFLEAYAYVAELELALPEPEYPYCISRPAPLTNEGSEFYIGFMRNAPRFPGIPSEDVVILITNEASSVMVNVTVGTTRFTRTVTPALANCVDIDSDTTRVQGITDRNRGVHVTAPDGRSIAVFGSNEEVFTTDAFLALPCQDLDLEVYDYCAISVPPASGASRGGNSSFLIVACSDNTVISFTPSQPVRDPENPSNMIPGGTEKTVTLQEGQTLYVRSREDLTGSYILSNRPISFFSGHECAHVPPSQAECSHLVEQIPPIGTWGTRFLCVPIAGQNSDDMFKALASQPNTTIIVTCTTSDGSPPQITRSFIAQAGQTMLYSTNQYCSVEADKPILLVQISPHRGFGEGIGGAFMIFVPAVTHYRNNLKVAFVSSVGFNFQHWLNIVVERAFFQPANITLGGERIESEWVGIPCSSGEVCGYGTQMQPPSNAAIVVAHSDPTASLGVNVYGISSSDGYGYPGGLMFT